MCREQSFLNILPDNWTMMAWYRLFEGREGGFFSVWVQSVFHNPVGGVEEWVVALTHSYLDFSGRDIVKRIRRIFCFSRRKNHFLRRMFLRVKDAYFFNKNLWLVFWEKCWISSMKSWEINEFIWKNSVLYVLIFHVDKKSSNVVLSAWEIPFLCFSRDMSGSKCLNSASWNKTLKLS